MSAAPPSPQPESPSATGVGGDKVLAAAQHIVKSLATSKNAADDMIHILSGFDNRLSSITNDLFPSPDPSSFSASGSSSEIPAAAAAAFDAADQLIQLWDATPEALVFEASEDDVAQYLAAVDVAVEHLACGGAGGARAGVAVQLAMVRLEEELRHLMVRHAVPLDPTGLFFSLRRLSLESMDDLDACSLFDAATPLSLDAAAPETARGAALGNSLEDQVFEPVRPEAVDELRAIADRMARAGYARELADAYCGVRRDLLDEYLSVLGVERLSIDEVQRIEWKLLNDKMKKWVHGVKTVVRVLLAGERRLCDQVLAASDELTEECFVESTKGCIMQILNFGDAVAVCPRSPEKVPRLLDMYEALAEVIPEMKDLCLGSSGDGVISDVQAILDRLGDAVRGNLFEFGKMLQQETSRRAMMAGEIHPMTRYVMNYLRLLVVYSETLDVLLDDGGDDHNAFRSSDDQDQEHLESMTPFGRRLLKLISYLEANLEEKSKLYEDAALECIFAMNNLLYIVQKVKDSELGKILGDHWIKRHSGKIRQYSKSYLRISWTKALSYFKEDGHGSGSGSGSGSGHSSSRMSIKEKFKNFNMAFEEIYRNQTLWKVPDPQLREELKISISENVIPAYRAFLGRYGNQVDGGRNPGKYVKYTPEDLESQLSDLFEGSPGSANHSRRRT
ncbi:exocyst complex component EXO70B1-like [Phragmites australis]|uniref:exocyst complex component EXO70B1-like n=1 Tax=Phragmites australis TaxID=29695 RepID=UPI002D7923C8|nr:exocyst complex component EXO70B1-like [Phragmites australis]